MKNNLMLSTPVSHSDWMWNHQQRIGHGKRSVKYILDRCKAVGWRRIYWRCLDGGQAFYASDLVESVAAGYDADNYHAWASPGVAMPDIFTGYQNFDSLKEAVAYGHKIGLEIHAWLTINEDDHSWGLISRFCRAHPEYRWVKRSGMPYNAQLSFAFDEVQSYKLGIVKEVLRYDVDGIFFDWMRTGDIRNGPQVTPDGTADFGYERPLVDGFKAKYKTDPSTLPNDDERWVQFRCEPQTKFMQAAHRLIKRKHAALPIAMMGHHPWSYRGDGTTRINGNRNGLLLDVARWAKAGLIDDLVAAGYFTGDGTPEKAYAYLKKAVGNHCRIWHYAWVPSNMREFDASLKTAAKLGAGQILYWESDYIDAPSRAEFGKAIMRA